jgi:hypothetical protein
MQVVLLHHSRATQKSFEIEKSERCVRKKALYIRVGWKKMMQFYETPAILLVINFVRRWLGAFIGLVCRQ